MATHLRRWVLVLGRYWIKVGDPPALTDALAGAAMTTAMPGDYVEREESNKSPAYLAVRSRLLSQEAPGSTAKLESGSTAEKDSLGARNGMMD
jgi:hypothetical protein